MEYKPNFNNFYCAMCSAFFFFQAEDGIRDRTVTGVQTCALPIWPANADVYIDQINMAKDENGEPGESTTSFAPDEHTVHCVINLNKAKAGTKVKFTWIGVDVENTKKNAEITSVDYTTNSFENKVHAHLTRPKDWPKGTYKVEVYINGALDKTITYTVE